MIHKVAKYIQQKELMSEGAKVLVAISGGADSVALLIVLKRLGYDCEALHCNFHLRGDESLRDEMFVRDLCKKEGVKLTVVHFDTAAYAAEKGISIEMAAREQRYEAFESHRKECGATAIAVAHHRNDSAETMLLNLVRGTGLKGLHGIQPKNGYVVRPLLCVERNEIVEYLEWRGAGYVTDSTNLESEFTRNRIRLQIIPLLQEINPSIIESLAATAERLGEAEKVYAKGIEEGIARVKNGNIINIAALEREPSPQALLHEILRPIGFNGSQINDILQSMDGESGRTFTGKHWQVVKDRTTLIITPNEDCSINTELPCNGTVETAQGRLLCTTAEFSGTIERKKEIATIDCDKVQMPLTLRNREEGDRFTPFGMRGSKLVSDYLTDRKKSLIDKQRQLVVTDATGKIVWLVGERLAACGAVDDSTKSIMRIEWQERE
ncbi:MAG: tRNA lysidine(34) synthetase TilS [Bacteroidaceae bacterium]|nr:tRNA lysidine(34) synthetase TilS [Bacteroidaceae bacterium]